MSASGMPLLFLGLCLLMGAEAYGEGDTSDLVIRPNLPRNCKEPPNTSLCGGPVTFRWYYDIFSDSCKVFPYRGCPNVNSFPSRKECMDRCIKTAGSPAIRDELDEIYGEPVAKPRMGGRIPFVKNVDPETIKSPHGEAVEGRSLHTDGPNFRPRNSPPLRPGHMNPEFGNNHPYNNRNGGFPPRDSHGAPHRNSNPMNGGSGFNSFRRPQMNQYVRSNNIQSPRLTMRSPPHAKPQTEEQKPAPSDQFMTDQDIFDEVSIPKQAPKKIQPKAEKTPAAKSDFMSDSDIFDRLPKITIPTKKVVGAKQAQEIKKPQQKNVGKEEESSPETNEKEGYPEEGGVFVDPDDAPVCMQFPETGPCKAYIRRWYYDPRKTECFTFIFGGCEGNKNSFGTKEECMKTCAASDKEEQTTSEEETKTPQTSRRYYGLRRQSRKNPLPVVMTSTPTEVKPVVMTTPSEIEPEAKMVKLEENGDEEQDNQDEGSDEQEEDSSSFSKEEEEEEEQNEEDMTDEESDKPKDNFPVVNHYYTYHNYGPQHARHGMVRTSSQTTGKVDDSSSSSSSSESSSSEEEKEEVKKVVKKQKNRGLLKRLPSPINIFFRFLKNLRPNKPKIIIRTNGQEPTSKDDNGARAKASGVTFVKLFFTKKGRKNNVDAGDRISPLSPLASFRLPHRSSPFSDIFREPEPRHAPFMEPPMHQHQHSYNSGPFNPGPMDFHPNSHNYQQPPPSEPMTSRFNGNPPMYPMDNLLWPSPSIDFIPPWDPMFNQEPSMPIAPRGEKNLACQKPVNEGLCLDSISVPRWFYDQRRGVCDIFYYTGCGGNENRFESYKQCHDVCMVKTPAPPTVPSALSEKEAEPLKEKEQPEPEKEPEVMKPEVEKEEEVVTVKVPEVQPVVKEEAKEQKVVEIDPVVHHGPAVVHTFEFANMHLDNRMEYILVVVIMILGGAALIVLVAITAYFMYKKHKLATRAAKEANIQKVFRAHAYPEVHKISVIELPRELPRVHDNLKPLN